MFDIGSGPASRSPFVVVFNFHERYFWPNVVAIEHILPHLTSVDLWPLYEGIIIISDLLTKFGNHEA